MRVTKQNLEDRISNINSELVDVKLQLGGRYGYFAIDLYKKYGNGMIKTLKTGTKKEVGTYLKGFINAFEYSRFLRKSY